MTWCGEIAPSLWAALAPGGRGIWGSFKSEQEESRKSDWMSAVPARQVLAPCKHRGTGVVHPKELSLGVKLLTRDQFWTNVMSILVGRAVELVCYLLATAA